MINNWLERIFGKNEGTNPNSRNQVKERLQLILAHDRVALTPQMLEDMRREIMTVVSKYVEIDQESIEISLETDQRTTVMVANLPIRAIKETLETVPTISNEINLDSNFEQNIDLNPEINPEITLSPNEITETNQKVSSLKELVQE
jgi:cell division topological specificity factor